MRPERADFKPEKVDLRPERADLRPERADLRPGKANFRPGRADLRPRIASGGGTEDGATERRRNKIALCGIIGHQPLRGRCRITSTSQ